MDKADTQAVVVKPPANGDGDDPRQMVYINVDKVVVDPNVQRRTKDERLTKMGNWNWDLAETPTVALRTDGLYAAIEGQNRILKRQKEAPGTSMWMVLRPSPATDWTADEAKVALGIAKGRKLHSSYDAMHVELAAGDPYWQAAVATLAEHEVEFTPNGQYNNSGVRGIAAITAVGGVMHSYDKTADTTDEAVTDGAALLGRVLLVIINAFDEQKAMWDGTLIRAVSGVIHRNPAVDLNRLTAKLAKVAATDWVAECRRRRGRTSPVEYLATLIMQDYNHALNAAKRLSW